MISTTSEARCRFAFTGVWLDRTERELIDGRQRHTPAVKKKALACRCPKACARHQTRLFRPLYELVALKRADREHWNVGIEFY